MKPTGMAAASWPSLGEWEFADSVDCSEVEASSEPTWAGRAAQAASVAASTKPRNIVPTPSGNKARKDEKERKMTRKFFRVLEETDEEDEHIDVNPKSRARLFYHRQSKRGFGNTVKAKRDVVASKKQAVEVQSGSGSPEIKRALELGEISAEALASGLGGTCRQLKTVDGRRAVREGKKLYSVSLPMGEGDETTLLVEEQRGRPATRTPYPHLTKRPFSPDWVHGKAIYEAKTKERVEREEIRAGMAAAGA